MSNCATCPSRGTCDIKDDDDSCSTGACSGGIRLPPGMTTIYDLDKDVERGSMVWAEIEGSGDEARVSPASLEAIAKAASLWDEKVYVVLMGPGGYRHFSDLIFEHGGDNLYHVRGRGVEEFHGPSYAATIADIIDRVKPAAFLCAASVRGRELASCLSAKLGVGVAASCVAVSAVAGGRLQMVRPMRQGGMLEEVFCGGLPQIATLRPGSSPLPPREEGRKGTVLTWTNYRRGDSMKVLSSEFKDLPWPEAPVLVSLGEGMSSEEDLKLAEELASLLGGRLACSRSVAEKGLISAEFQVGEGGRPVQPRVYLAFGISGSPQHMAGLAGAGSIVAINSDPEAPIHSMADISLVADGREVMRAMIEALR